MPELKLAYLVVLSFGYLDYLGNRFLVLDVEFEVAFELFFIEHSMSKFINLAKTLQFPKFLGYKYKMSRSRSSQREQISLEASKIN